MAAYYGAMQGGGHMNADPYYSPPYARFQYESDMPQSSTSTSTNAGGTHQNRSINELPSNESQMWQHMHQYEPHMHTMA
jgi:hypothetical protein